jgi:hypothetical protein
MTTFYHNTVAIYFLLFKKITYEDIIDRWNCGKEPYSRTLFVN